MFINFKKVRWRNFFSTGNEWTEILLDKSKSTVISGANGAGKSTFVEAICYSLYGKPYRDINKPKLVNSITGKHLLVEIEFEIGRKKYLVRRGMKPNVFEIFVDGQLLNQSSDVREYQEQLEKNVLRMNYKSFCQVVVLGTANFTPFMQLPAHHRREVIEDLLDIQIFSKMLTLLKDKINQNKGDLLENGYQIRLVTEKVALTKENLANLRQNTDDLIRSKKAMVQELKDEIHEMESDRDMTEKTTKELRVFLAEHRDIEAKHSKFVEVRKDLLRKRDNHQQHIEFFHDKDTCPTCTQEIDVDFKKDYIEKRTTKIAALDEGLEDINVMIAKLDAELEDGRLKLKELERVSRAFDSIEVKLAALERSVRSYEREIEELKDRHVETDGSEATTLIKLYAEETALKERKEELLKDKSINEIAQAMLKDGGIKSKIIKQYIPVINKLVNKYLAAMDFFIQFELNEKFEEAIKSRFRDDFSYNSFSEGEKSRIDLALLFTWRAVARMRNSAATNLLIMDEVFDSSLDSTGTEELMKLIDTLDHETNIFVISHRNADNLYDRFHSSIRFEKVKNFSRIA